MNQRVLLIVLGGVIYFVLREFLDVPMRLAAVIGLIPFGLAEAKGLVGPYEKSARDIMFEETPEEERTDPKP